MKVTKLAAGQVSKASPSKPSTAPAPLSLPKERSEPVTELGGYLVLLYGEKKIGKTTLAARFPDAFFLMCEPGGKALRIFQRPVNTWPEFKGYVKLLEKDQQFKTVVVDTVDLAYRMCQSWVCQDRGIEHPSDDDWGKGWDAVRDEFVPTLNRLLTCGKGVLLTSHAEEKEIKKRTGVKYHVIQPTMPGGARRVVEAQADIWGYYHYGEGGKRVLSVVGDDHVAAGHRFEDRFVGVSEIDMGRSADEGFQNFMDAFNRREEVRPVVPRLSVKKR